MTTVYSLHGTIGAGKSTILSYLEKELNVVIIPEPVKEWGDALNEFYENKKGSVEKLQLTILDSMEKIYDNIMQLQKEGVKSVYIERSPWDVINIFMPSNKHKFESEEKYNEIVDKFAELGQRLAKNVKSRKMIYVRVDLATAIKRVKNRGEDIDEKYQRILLKSHEDSINDNFIIFNNSDHLLDIQFPEMKNVAVN